MTDPAQSAPSAERYADLKEFANHKISKFGTDGRVQLPAYKLIAILIRLEQAETRAETALAAQREKAIQECIKISDERAKQNRVHALKFSAADQRNMYDRALANAGEASRISDALRALLTVAAQTPEEK